MPELISAPLGTLLRLSVFGGRLGIDHVVACPAFFFCQLYILEEVFLIYVPTFEIKDGFERWVNPSNGLVDCPPVVRAGFCLLLSSGLPSHFGTLRQHCFILIILI